MASLIKQKNGGSVIQFVDHEQKRKTIRLGKCTARHAADVLHRVELLVAAKLTRDSVDAKTVTWLNGIDDQLHTRLANVGLVEQRGDSLLGPFMERYLESRKGISTATVVQLRYTERELLEFFGPNRQIASVTEGDADEFRQFLIGKGLAENTIRRKCGRARQFFNAAIKKRIITTNPFCEIPCGVVANEERFRLISQADSEKILEACPDSQWRVIFALCRWGGLRCPSEIFPLKWSDVNWEHNRVLVTSPKTAHQGKATRMIPLFPELQRELSAAFEEAEAGCVHVVTRYREGNANLRTQFNRIIKRAGLEPWGKPFQNLRSTRETELAERFPMHVVCRWIGNSELVAAKHYLQLTDDHFSQAIGTAVSVGTDALQKALQ